MAPAMVAIIIILLIWVIYPAYTSPLGGGVKEKMVKYNELKTELDVIKGKNSVIQALASELNSSSRTADKETLMDFLPQKAREYEIIDNLNYLILKEELLGLAISVSQPDKKNSAAIIKEEEAEVSEGVSAVPSEKKAEPKFFEVNFSVQGGYDKIKDIFLKVYGLRMFNKIISLKIEPAVKEGETASDSLKATAILEFAFMEESGSFTSPEDSVFSKTTFDSQVIKDINSKKSTPLLPDLTVDIKGKANPFLP